MIRLASIIETFEAEFLQQYGATLPASQRYALTALTHCRSAMSPKMQVECGDCAQQIYVPHSCGHRSCPHCQAHESQRWIDRQLQKQVPGDYFMITFTVPAELRPLARAQPQLIYALIMQSAWDTLHSFSRNDKTLQGTPGAAGVFHTHSRRLDFHPHVHLVMPAAAINKKSRQWRVKQAKYLFNHKALAKVFRGKILAGITQAGFALPVGYPEKWVVDVKNVGNGEKALVYLGRYLYRGVIQEKDILSCDNGQVTFRYQDSKTKKIEHRSLSGVAFLRLILQHVLPKGFRRARNFGFLHPNSKRLIQRVQLLLKLTPQPVAAAPNKRPTLRCPCCGGEMKIVRTRIKPLFAYTLPPNNFKMEGAGREMPM